MKSRNASRARPKSISATVQPSLSTAQRARLRALARRPDDAIDYSDIPPLDDTFWKKAIRNPLYKPTKQVTTVRVDADVLMWLKGQGKG